MKVFVCSWGSLSWSGLYFDTKNALSSWPNSVSLYFDIWKYLCVVKLHCIGVDLENLALSNGYRTNDCCTVIVTHAYQVFWLVHAAPPPIFFGRHAAAADSKWPACRRPHYDVCTGICTDLDTCRTFLCACLATEAVLGFMFSSHRWLCTSSSCGSLELQPDCSWSIYLAATIIQDLVYYRS